MMKKTYENPVAEKIEFDYAETVAACSPWGGNQGGNSTVTGHIHPTYGQSVYRDSNSGYNCESSLTPDQTCGFESSGKVHTSNVGYICVPHN